MSATVTRGRVVFRRWDRQTGLDEVEQEFATLEDLYALCLQNQSSLLVDRVIIEGEDAARAPRTLTLVFQSVSVSGQDWS